MFAKEYIKVLDGFKDKTVFVDLVGGSGLLSHITRYRRPDAAVVYNDFDNYRQRINNIPQTNKLLDDLRNIATGLPRNKMIKGDAREHIFDRIRQEEEQHGFVDYITVSSSIMFSMKYETSLAGLRTQALYNNIRKTDYPVCSDYLDGLTVTSYDYRALFNMYKDVPDVVFLVDPPYLGTEIGTYKMYWGLGDYLDVLNILKGHAFVYFTSNKSSIIELCDCDWMGKNKDLGNPFENCAKKEFNAHMN